MRDYFFSCEAARIRYFHSPSTAVRICSVAPMSRLPLVVCCRLRFVFQSRRLRHPRVLSVTSGNSSRRRSRIAVSLPAISSIRYLRPFHHRLQLAIGFLRRRRPHPSSGDSRSSREISSTSTAGFVTNQVR